MRIFLVLTALLLVSAGASGAAWADAAPQFVVTIRMPQSGGAGTTYTVSGFVTANAISTISPSLEIDGRADSGVEVLVNKVKVTMDSARNFQAFLTLSPGENNILVEATNSFGTSILQMRVTYETSKTSSSAVSQEDVAQMQMTPATGGTLISVDRQAQIFVPPLALLQDTVISIISLSPQGRPAAPDGWRYLSKAYDFLPSGTRFLKDTVMRITLPQPPAAGEQVDLFVYDQGSHQWKPVEGAVMQDNTVVANIVRHFTVYAVLAQPQQSPSGTH